MTASRIPPRPDLLAGEDLPPPPRQGRSRARRAKIEASALALFGRHGYEATSIEDIAAAAVMPVGAFYLHFRSKRQLLLSLMNDLLVGLSQVTFEGAGGHPRELVRRILADGLARDLRYLGAYRAWQEATLSDLALARKQRAIHTWTSARVAALFRALQRLPGSRRGVDATALARLLDALFWSLLAQASRRRGPALHQALDTTVHLVYHALFADGA